MKSIGNLLKMNTINNNPIDYYLVQSNSETHLNTIIGKEILLEFLGKINCVKCGSQTKTSFAQGFCYKCFISAPETEACVLKPELCRAHEGIARDMEYAAKHCLQEQIVYLASSSETKIGVTRSSQMPTRWIDQGATHSIILARTPNRFLAGQIEVALKKHFTDKTDWRKMLKNEIIVPKLIEAKISAKSALPEYLQDYCTADTEVLEFIYPSMGYPKKLNSISFDKTNFIQGILTGIKGQYLYIDYENVINIRKHNGYLTSFEY